MKQPSPPLTYLPAYLGLFAALFLAAVCNTFLDIKYGAFGFETLFWAVVFATTVRIGWRQRGEANDDGRQGQKVVLVLTAILSVLIFIPMWGFPRAGLAILAMLQASQNCVAVKRRDLHLGLLVSAVMVMFAASHYRADWTMLFYLVPYVIAVVFTLVAEQISRRTQDVRRDSLASGSARGQGIAILAATTTILMAALLLYAVTPQVTRPYLFWKFGQVGNLVRIGGAPGTGAAGLQPGAQGGSASGGAAEPAEARPGGWPTPGEMRAAARRDGMPGWQSAAIDRLADLIEMTDLVLRPIRLGLDEWWNDLKTWFREHQRGLGQSLAAMIVAALLAAAWMLLREARPVTWLRARLDYLWLGLLGRHEQGSRGVFQYYAALQRLLDLEGLARQSNVNAREYLFQLVRRYQHLRGEAVEMTSIFEQARYGNREATADQAARMRALYLRMFRGLDDIGGVGRLVRG